MKDNGDNIKRKYSKCKAAFWKTIKPNYDDSVIWTDVITSIATNIVVVEAHDSIGGSTASQHSHSIFSKFFLGVV